MKKYEVEIEVVRLYRVTIHAGDLSEAAVRAQKSWTACAIVNSIDGLNTNFQHAINWPASLDKS